MGRGLRQVCLIGFCLMAATAWAAPPAQAAPNPIPCGAGTCPISPPAQIPVQPTPNPNPQPQPQPGPGENIFNLEQWVSQAGQFILPQLRTSMNQDPGAHWFDAIYQRMVNIAVSFLGLFVILAMLQTGYTALRGGPALGVFVRSLVMLPVSIVLTLGAIAMTHSLIVLVDGMTAYILAGFADNIGSFFANAGIALGGPGALMLFSGGGAFLAFIAALIVVGGAFMIVFELLVRNAVIYVCLLFMPLTFVAMIWPRTAHLARRLCEVLVGVVLAKFIIAAVLVLGVAAFSASPFNPGPAADPGFATVAMGAVVVLVAVLSPLTLLKVIPAVETAAIDAFGAPGRNWASIPHAQVRGQVQATMLGRLQTLPGAAPWLGGRAPAAAGQAAGAAKAGAAATGAGAAVAAGAVAAEKAARLPGKAVKNVTGAVPNGPSPAPDRLPIPPSNPPAAEA